MPDITSAIKYIRQTYGETANMLEEVFPQIFRLEIPLPDNPLKSINAYIVKGDGRYLMIDTGMNRSECRDAMNAGLKALDVDLTRTDFFITHHHADHFGLVSDLACASSKIYFNHPDTRFINTPNVWDRVIEAAVANGFPEKEIVSVMQKHPARRFQQQGPLNLTLLKEGDLLPIGEYVFQCIETPGHTQGHLCLYEPRTKVFFAGDHILEDITPNIIRWSDNENPLQEYMDSLDKINHFDIALVLPGHRRVFTDHRKRIAELKHHHESRASEVLSLLKTGRQNAFQIAAGMTWDITYDSWEDFPLPQKWFASGEAFSHLLYLLARNEIKRERLDGRIFFSLI